MDYIKSFKKYLEAVDNIDDKEAKSKFKDLDDKDIDNDGDVDDSDKYLHHKLSVVNKKADEGHMYGHDDEDSELEEMNVTGNLDGGEGPPKTPYAFGDMDDEDVEKAGYKKVKQESMFMKMSKQLHEVSYRDFKKDPTSTPQQKVNRGIMEVNKMLAEMEKIVHNNLRLKTEMGVQSNHFWQTTGKRFLKINERMIRIANKLKELSQ
jgi:hypothetical protein|tara:strand:+ start:811 stop:1431 length:621 start_codon:yes stop_codon:yes gene_type:complete